MDIRILVKPGDPKICRHIRHSDPGSVYLHGSPRPFHSLVATAFFTWINFNSIAFCIVVLNAYDGDIHMKEKDDDIARPGMVSKPKRHLIGPIQ